MTREEVLNEVKKAVISLIGTTDVTEDTKFDDDLVFDDLDFVELFIELEGLDFTKQEMDESKITEAKTVKDVVDYLMTVIT